MALRNPPRALDRAASLDPKTGGQLKQAKLAVQVTTQTLYERGIVQARTPPLEPPEELWIGWARVKEGHDHGSLIAGQIDVLNPSDYRF